MLSANGDDDSKTVDTWLPANSMKTQYQDLLDTMFPHLQTKEIPAVGIPNVAAAVPAGQSGFMGEKINE